MAQYDGLAQLILDSVFEVPLGFVLDQADPPIYGFFQLFTIPPVALPQTSSYISCIGAVGIGVHLLIEPEGQILVVDPGKWG